MADIHEFKFSRLTTAQNKQLEAYQRAVGFDPVRLMALSNGATAAEIRQALKADLRWFELWMSDALHDAEDALKAVPEYR